MIVAIPSKPGQRLQCAVAGANGRGNDMSQSLPNQVNDFNTVPGRSCWTAAAKSQSLPNQVNDFNLRIEFTGEIRYACRNPFQTRSTTSINIPLRHLLYRECRNPFQTRSTTSICSSLSIRDTYSRCRNPFQTRSTTSISGGGGVVVPVVDVAIPSKPGQRLQ